MDTLHRLGISVLSDGSLAHIAPVRRADRSRILAFLHSLSEDTRFMRFLSAAVDLEAEADILTDVDGVDRVALVATTPCGEAVIGHACYERIGPCRAEAAVVVADAFRRRRIGSLLLLHLAEAAAAHGITTFVGASVPENHAVVAYVRSLFDATVDSGPGWMRITFPTRSAGHAASRARLTALAA